MNPHKHPVYFGGTRHPYPSYLPLPAVVRSVIQSGCAVHVGCQSGVDQSVVFHALQAPLFLSVFAVAAHHSQAPAHVIGAGARGARVVFAAGGTQAPIKARYLLRSIAALQGCQQALFFQPGPGSLAVAREACKMQIPVFAIATWEPQAIPHTAGAWSFVHPYSYYAPFSNQLAQVWQWQPGQQALF